MFKVNDLLNKEENNSRKMTNKKDYSTGACVIWKTSEIPGWLHVTNTKDLDVSKRQR